MRRLYGKIYKRKYDEVHVVFGATHKQQIAKIPMTWAKHAPNFDQIIAYAFIHFCNPSCKDKHSKNSW